MHHWMPRPPQAATAHLRYITGAGRCGTVLDMHDWDRRLHYLLERSVDGGPNLWLVLSFVSAPLELPSDARCGLYVNSIAHGGLSCLTSQFDLASEQVKRAGQQDSRTSVGESPARQPVAQRSSAEEEPHRDRRPSKPG